MSTTSDYLSVANNLARFQKYEADQTSVKTATAYYQANIGKVKSVDDLLGNYRLLSYALSAFGLGDQVNNKALIRKVLQEGTSSPAALANTLPNVAWKAFAKAFNFSAAGAAAPTSSASVATAVSDYTEQQLESDQGSSNPGVQLALYFKRVAPTISTGYSVLADNNLLQVAQTIFNLPPTANASEIDKQATQIQKLMPLSDLKDPVKLARLVERFTAAYDGKYGPSSGATSSLTPTDGNTPTTVSAASTVMSGIVSANSQLLAQQSSYTPLISPALLSGLTLGGY
ncbi:MAG: DUF1217 domain-containing protein [Pseudomonadota bacterium]|nr:DUF1217 domain-containing protein [Pseudomonadota bacterium]